MSCLQWQSALTSAGLEGFEPTRRRRAPQLGQLSDGALFPQHGMDLRLQTGTQLRQLVAIPHSFA